MLTMQCTLALTRALLVVSIDNRLSPGRNQKT